MSEFSFQCPHCQNVLEVDESYCGRKAECPYCNNKFIVPSTVGGRTRCVDSPGGKKSSMIWVSVCLGVLVVALTTIVLIQNIGKSPSRQTDLLQACSNQGPIQNKSNVKVSTEVQAGKLSDRNKNGTANVLNACVTINCVSGAGTGFFARINGEDRIVTCKHVVDDEPVIVIKDVNGREFRVLKVRISKERDIAVIDVSGNEIEPSSLEVVRDVSVAGVNSQLECFGDSEGTGVIVPCSGKLLGIGPTSVETDAPFVPGNSGGPVVDKMGRVIGVASLITRLNEGNKWVKGTRFEKQSRHFAVRVDNLRWGELVEADVGIIAKDDLKGLNQVAKKAIDEGNVEKAIALYMYSAEREDPEALNKLGAYLLFAEKKSDMESAVRLFQKAADKKSGAGMANLGLCYLYGYGVRKDSAKAADLFRKAYSQGDVLGEYMLGVCYRDGSGVPRDINQAVQHIKTAAGLGEMHAQNAYGDLLWEGSGVDKDWNLAFEYFSKSANQGFAEAQWNMGLCYENEVGVKKDMTLAAQWFLKSAEQGDGRAQDRMGDLYRDGEGVSKDSEKSFYWYERGARQGNPGAQYSLGVCYRDGTGVSMDMVKAVACFRLSAAQGYAASQNQLGLRYENGEGVSKDLNEARKWYEMAANNGMKAAASNIALMYREGKGVHVNYETALWWYEKAQNYDEATALIYEAGNHYAQRKDYDNAIYWYKKRGGEVSAQNYIGVQYWNSENYKQAFVWFEKASKWSASCTSRGWAYFNLAKCYLYGCGVEDNVYIAERYFKESEKNGVEVDQSWFDECRKKKYR